jgi:hypothetical protein
MKIKTTTENKDLVWYLARGVILTKYNMIKKVERWEYLPYCSLIVTLHTEFGVFGLLLHSKLINRIPCIKKRLLVEVIAKAGQQAGPARPGPIKKKVERWEYLPYCSLIVTMHNEFGVFGLLLHSKLINRIPCIKKRLLVEVMVKADQQVGPARPTGCHHGLGTTCLDGCCHTINSARWIVGFVARFSICLIQLF